MDKVLKSLLEVHLPKLYPGELHKVTVHHDQATSHTARVTPDYAYDLEKKLGIRLLKNSQIPVKSPDMSPLTFFGFGYLKSQLFRRKSKTEGGLWKVMKHEWSKIDLAIVTRVYSAWKRRLRLVRKISGRHIENTKDIHLRRRHTN